MSMRHHWHELDELLAQLDREARFKQGPYRPGLKALRDTTDAPAGGAERIDDPAAGDVIPLKRGITPTAG